MTTEEKYRRILSNHLPSSAVDWVYDYLNLHKVHFHITRERTTKLGDYRRPFDSHNFHEISINGDLNPYFFLWVFLHEAAHLETHLRYDHSDSSPKLGREMPVAFRAEPCVEAGDRRLRWGRSVSPHGHEWQSEYARLLIAHNDFFPSDIQPLIARYTRRIPLSHSVAKQIEATLHHYDADYNPDDAPLTLDQLTAGTRFCLMQKPELCFEALEKRRTRWLCRELRSGRQYLVNGAAQVIVISP